MFCEKKKKLVLNFFDNILFFSSSKGANYFCQKNKSPLPLDINQCVRPIAYKLARHVA